MVEIKMKTTKIKIDKKRLEENNKNKNKQYKEETVNLLKEFLFDRLKYPNLIYRSGAVTFNGRLSGNQKHEYYGNSDVRSNIQIILHTLNVDRSNFYTVNGNKTFGKLKFRGGSDRYKGMRRTLVSEYLRISAELLNKGIDLYKIGIFEYMNMKYIKGRGSNLITTDTYDGTIFRGNNANVNDKLIINLTFLAYALTFKYKNGKKVIEIMNRLTKNLTTNSLGNYDIHSIYLIERLNDTFIRQFRRMDFGRYIEMDDIERDAIYTSTMVNMEHPLFIYNFAQMKNMLEIVSERSDMTLYEFLLALPLPNRKYKNEETGLTDEEYKNDVSNGFNKVRKANETTFKNYIRYINYEKVRKLAFRNFREMNDYCIVVELAKSLNPLFQRQSSSTVERLKNVKISRSEMLGFRIVQSEYKNNPKAFFTDEPTDIVTIGSDTGCCFTMTGQASSLVEAALVLPTASIIKGRFSNNNWFSFIWEMGRLAPNSFKSIKYGEDKKIKLPIYETTLVLDNIEANMRLGFDEMKYINGFINSNSPYHTCFLGTGYNDLKPEVERDFINGGIISRIAFPTGGSPYFSRYGNDSSKMYTVKDGGHVDPNKIDWVKITTKERNESEGVEKYIILNLLKGIKQRTAGMLNYNNFISLERIDSEKVKYIKELENGKKVISSKHIENLSSIKLQTDKVYEDINDYEFEVECSRDGIYMTNLRVFKKIDIENNEEDKGYEELIEVIND